MDTTLYNRKTLGGLNMVFDKSLTAGDVFWVGAATSGASDTAGFGSNPDKPFATLDYAFDTGNTEASKADTIFVLPEHTEATITGSIAIDKIGVQVIGIGHQGSKPTLTFTGTAGEILISANDVLFSGFNLIGAVDDLVTFFDINATGVTIENCRMSTSSGKEAICFVDLLTTKDYLTIRNCQVFQPTDPDKSNGDAATGFLYLVDSEHVLVEDCRIIGNFETAIFHNKNTKCTDFLINRCTLQTDLSDSTHFILVAASEGGVRATLGIRKAATDVTDAQLWGTLGAKFWISTDSSGGNDSAGGQAAQQGTPTS